MATGKETAVQPTESKGLASAVKTEVASAKKEAKTGNVETIPESQLSDKITRSRR